MAADAASFIDALGLAQVDMFGFSTWEAKSLSRSQ